MDGVFEVESPRSPTGGRWLALAAAMALIVVLVACSYKGSAPPVAHSSGGAATTMSGGDVYLVSCARCHGTEREGKVDAPALSAVRINSLGDDPLRLTIGFGKGRMPSFPNLSQAQVDALIAFLRGA